MASMVENSQTYSSVPVFIIPMLRNNHLLTVPLATTKGTFEPSLYQLNVAGGLLQALHTNVTSSSSATRSSVSYGSKMIGASKYINITL